MTIFMIAYFHARKSYSIASSAEAFEDMIDLSHVLEDSETEILISVEEKLTDDLST